MTRTIDDDLADAQAATTSVTINIRGDLVERIGELEAERARLAKGDGLAASPESVRINAELSTLAKQAEAGKRTYSFVAVGYPAWSELLAAHPPKNGQGDHDPATFPYAAIAASCVEPTGLTDEKVRRLAAKLNVGQWARLWGACLAVNVYAEASVPFVESGSQNRSTRRQASKKKPTTAVPAVSLVASSSAVS